MKKYCYWSVATGNCHSRLMENCIESARSHGEFADFIILSDRELVDCQCYDAHEPSFNNGFFKLHYLKAGMTRLRYEYFVWLDADSLFFRRPMNILDPVSISPLHTPLRKHSPSCPQRAWRDTPRQRIVDKLKQYGVEEVEWTSISSFWIVHHEAIETVYELAMGFFNLLREDNITVNVDIALHYAMMTLCGDPDRHIINNTNTWGEAKETNPCILHLKHSETSASN